MADSPFDDRQEEVTAKPGNITIPRTRVPGIQKLKEWAYLLLCPLTPQQAAGTGGASRQGAQSCLVLSLPGSPAKRHKASMRVQSFSKGVSANRNGLVYGDGYAEGAAFAGFAPDLDPACHLVDEALDDIEPETCSLSIFS